MKGFYTRLTRMARLEKEQKMLKGALLGDPLDDGRQVVTYDKARIASMMD